MGKKRFLVNVVLEDRKGFQKELKRREFAPVYKIPIVREDGIGCIDFKFERFFGGKGATLKGLWREI